MKLRNKVLAVPFPGLDAGWVRVLDGRRCLQSLLGSGKDSSGDLPS